jgi:hypothetical protein
MAVEIIYLIDDTTLKQLSTLQQNIDPKVLNNSIRRAQEIFIQPLLGTVLYKKILQLVKDNQIDNVGNEKYATLYYDYIVVTLSEYATALCQQDILIRTTNSNIGALTTNQQASVTMKDLQQLIDRLMAYAANYADALSKFLQENYNDYPELNENNRIDTMSPLISPIAAQSNIFFRRRIKYRNGWDNDCCN